MTAHATPSQLAAYLPAGTVVGDEAEVLRQLERASEDVDYWTTTPYELDEDTGLAADIDIAAALAKATCAVVEQWLDVDEANSIDGRARTQSSVNGASGTRAPSQAPRALHILNVAGLR